jgi:hypothetical protein
MARSRSGLSLFDFRPYATGQAGKRDLLRGDPMENLFGTPSNDPYAASSVVNPNLLVYQDDPTREGGPLYNPEEAAPPMAQNYMQPNEEQGDGSIRSRAASMANRGRQRWRPDLLQSLFSGGFF